MRVLPFAGASASSVIGGSKVALDASKQHLFTFAWRSAYAFSQWFRQPRFLVSVINGVFTAYLCAIIPSSLGAWGLVALAAGWSAAATAGGLAALMFHRASGLWHRRRGNPAEGLKRLGKIQKLSFVVMGASWALLLVTPAIMLLMFAGPIKLVLAFIVLAVGIATYSLCGVIGGPPTSVALLEWVTKPRWPTGPWRVQVEQALVAAARHDAAITSERSLAGRGPTRLGRLVGVASRQTTIGSEAGMTAWPADLSVSPRWVLDDIRWRAIGSFRLVCGMLPVVALLLLIGLPGAQWLVRLAPLLDPTDVAAEETPPSLPGSDEKRVPPSASQAESGAVSDGKSGNDSETAAKGKGQGSAGDQGAGQARDGQASGTANSRMTGAQAQDGANEDSAGRNGAGQNGSGEKGAGSNGTGSGAGPANNGNGAQGRTSGQGDGSNGEQAQAGGNATGAGTNTQPGAKGGQQGTGSMPGGQQGVQGQGAQGQGNSRGQGGGAQGNGEAQDRGQGGAQTGANPAGAGQQPGTANGSPAKGASGTGTNGLPSDENRPGESRPGEDRPAPGQPNSASGTAAPQNQATSGKGSASSGAGQPSTNQPLADKVPSGGGRKPGGNAGVGSDGSAPGGQKADARKEGLPDGLSDGHGSGQATGGRSAGSQAPVAPAEIVPDATGSMTIRLPGTGRQREGGEEPMPPLQRLDPLAVPPPAAGAGPAITINLPTLRGGASADQRSAGPAPAAPALPRHVQSMQLPSQQPLPAWVGHILEGAR